MRIIFAGSLTAALALLVVACSSSGEGSPNTGGFNCSSGCDKIAAAACPNSDPRSDCIAECEGDLAEAGTCSTSFGAVLNCALSQPITCDASGDPSIEENLIAKCTNESIAYARCDACRAEASDDACDTCMKTTCCAAQTAIYDDPNIAAYTRCFSACNDSSCRTACANQYPTILEKAGGISQCRAAKCQMC